MSWRERYLQIGLERIFSDRALIILNASRFAWSSLPAVVNEGILETNDTHMIRSKMFISINTKNQIYISKYRRITNLYFKLFQYHNAEICAIRTKALRYFYSKT